MDVFEQAIRQQIRLKARLEEAIGYIRNIESD